MTYNAHAETSRELLLDDPRLAQDVPAKEFPDLAEAPRRSGRNIGASGRSRT